MRVVQMAEGIYYLGSNIQNNDLFEGLWPIPQGVTLNSYLVKGEKNALIDFKCDWGGSIDLLRRQLSEKRCPLESIDYLVLNHLEPDHTGWLREFSEINREVTFIMTKKAVAVVRAFFGVEDRVTVVSDGQTLDLGNGKELVFYEAPNIHWPETMVTYEKSSKILFSCDAFGSFGALGDAVFDDQISDEMHDFYAKETLRYYANIVSSFSGFVEKGINKLKDLPISQIAPSHGPIWRQNPQAIIDYYVKLASYAKGPAEPEITVIWGSMYGNTKEMAHSVIQGIRSTEVPVHVHRVPNEDLSYVLASAWRSAGLVFGMPTYEYKMFPPIAHVIDLFERKHVFNKKVFRFGAWGWSGGAQKEFEKITEGLKWEFSEPVEWQGKAGAEVLQAGYDKGRRLALEIKEAYQKES